MYVCSFFLFPEGESAKENTPTSNLSEPVHDEDEREVPSVVIYLVEPFTLGSDQPELHRLSLLALLRCYQSILSAVPENIRNNISVQVNISNKHTLRIRLCISSLYFRLYHWRVLSNLTNQETGCGIVTI